MSNFTPNFIIITYFLYTCLHQLVTINSYIADESNYYKLMFKYVLKLGMNLLVSVEFFKKIEIKNQKTKTNLFTYPYLSTQTQNKFYVINNNKSQQLPLT